MNVWLNYLKLDEELPDPQYAYPTDGCFDIVSRIDTVVLPDNDKPEKVPTGFAFEVPTGYELQVRSRSGLAAKYGIQVFNSPGTIDTSYRGEVCVLLINIGGRPYEVKKGDRIAQAKLAIKPNVILHRVKTLQTTDRGANGFGSTGV